MLLQKTVHNMSIIALVGLLGIDYSGEFGLLRARQRIQSSIRDIKEWGIPYRHVFTEAGQSVSESLS